ncbi:MAG TPA: prolipoprotein diacylglyceryl transferase family protein [Vicinamibacterales bacterium]|nr:prolipoprotein diacylglyceryl transferase family protein [Vicinamibacterales bacterium]
MKFPVFIAIGPWRLHPHVVFELLAYAIGFQTYLWLRRRRGDPIGAETRWWIVIVAALGGLLGSQLLAGLESPAVVATYWRQPLVLFSGKTIVGGLIGGTIAVEWTKRALGVATRTGDLFAVPLAIGIAVGRIGCFLTGLADQTYGTPTAFWTAIDFGDGIPRHPTQLYEIAFLLMLAAALTALRGRLPRTGDEFRAFMVAYFAFRLAVDGLKPDPVFVAGLSSIQWACAAMLAYYVPDIRRWLQARSQP